MRKKSLAIALAMMLFMTGAFYEAIEANAATPDQVVTQSKKYLGVKYVYGGTTPSGGFDCSGFTSYVFKDLGINLKRTAAQQYTQGTPVSKSNLKAGDLVFFAGVGGKGGISHVGIYLGGSQMISATTSGGVRIDNMNTNPYWGPRYAGAKRLDSVKDAAPKPVELPPVTDGNFADVSSSHLAHEAIKNLNIQGIISGFANQEFRPNDTVTRGQASAMINRVLGLEASSASPYSDVGTTHSFAKDIAAMTEYGILQGYSNGRFGVEDTLTKAQLAIILDRAFDIVKNVDEQVQSSTIYQNVTTATPASREIIALKAIDQTKVFQTSEFYFNNATTRAEFSAALYSAMSLQ